MIRVLPGLMVSAAQMYRRSSASSRVVQLAVIAVCMTVGLWAGEGFAQPGTVLSEQKISATEGGLGGALGNKDHFGSAVTVLGDLDGDGVNDLAVGASQYGRPGGDYGAVWILFLNADGTVKSEQIISRNEGGFPVNLDYSAGFGKSLAPLGDLDGDGVLDLAVGAWSYHWSGGVFILFLNTDGTVKAYQEITNGTGGLSGTLESHDQFGQGLTSLGDFDGDGVVDLAVGAGADDDGGQNRGAVWLLFLNTDGTVKAEQKISDTEGGFTGELHDTNIFGSDVASLGDLDGDGVGDVAVGAGYDNGGGSLRGAVWILFLNSDGTVKAHQKIGEGTGGFTGVLDDRDYFGFAMAALGDIDGDGVRDLAVGAPNDDDGVGDAGAVWILFLNTNGTVKSHQKISGTEGRFGGVLDLYDLFAYSLASLGDFDGDGAEDLAVGAILDDDGAVPPDENFGAVWLLYLDAPLDHFKCYKAKDLKNPKFEAQTVTLADQFGVNDGPFEVKKPFLMCNPTDKNGEGIHTPADRLTCYKIKGPKLDKDDRPHVEVVNQLGTVQLEAKKPFLLCVPSAKTVLP